MSEESLNPEAVKLLDRYLFRRIVPTGVVATLVGLSLGFLINEVARGGAYTKALDLFARQMSQVAQGAGEAKAKAEAAREQADASAATIAQLLSESEKNVSLLEGIVNDSAVAEQVAAELGTNESFQAQLVSGFDDRVKSLNNRVVGVEQEVRTRWPNGSYCIFANGKCPVGFTRSEGYIRALWQVRGDARYVQDINFGDSRVGSHGRQDRNPDAPDWHGEILLAVCCK